MGMPTTWNWSKGRESGYAYEQIKESKMTTKQITNEMIFEKLGWTSGDGYWFAPFCSSPVKVLPDPLHDLNATFKYVWPRFRNDYIKKRVKDKNATFEMIMKELWQLCGWFLDHDNPTLAICQAFMGLPVEEDE